MSFHALSSGCQSEYNDENCTSFEEESIVRAITDQLKITVVPDITAGAGINGDDFDAKLSDEESSWFDEFKKIYHTYKQKPTAKHKIQAVLINSAEPLKLALKLFAACPDCNSLKKKTLAAFVLESVCEMYHNMTNGDGVTQNSIMDCDDNTRMVAFNFIKISGIVPLQKAVINTYKLHKILYLLIPKLQQLTHNGYYKDVANWCILLKVTNVFGLYDLILPLILQDRVSLVEDYLVEAKQQQLPTVQYLDTLLDKRKTVLEYCDEIIGKYNYSYIKHDFLTYRTMSKLVRRLVKKFNIDVKYTPNVEHFKCSSYLRYLFHKYNEGGMSLESWRELVRDEVNQSKALQLDLIQYIVKCGRNHNEAVYWMKTYNIPLEDCPMSIQLQLEQPSKCINNNDDNSCSEYNNNKIEFKTEKEKDDTNKNNEEKIDNAVNVKIFDKCIALEGEDETSIACFSKYNVKKEYINLSISMENVLWIENKETFLEMLSYLEYHNHIAFDSEWKPGVQSSTYSVAVLQLSTIERVYLVDCLSKNIDASLWYILGLKIFNNMEIMKIGFSLNQDIFMLHKSIPALQLNLQLSSGYLDLRDLWHRLKYKLNIKLPYESCNIKGEGLSALAELCFGKKLDKSNQCSNWAKRPLRHEQIIYAAIDAYCLISIYHVFVELLSKHNIDVDAIVQEIMMSCVNSYTKFLTDCPDNARNNKHNIPRCELNDKERPNNETVEGIEQQQQQEHQQLLKKPSTVQVKSCNIKLLCDFMLHDLITELRKLGLDCVQMFPSDDLNSYIELAKREKYTVLSRGLHYHVFCRTLIQTQCLEIDVDTLDKQVIKLLQRLNIQISLEDLFSRCLKCNCQEFILITPIHLLYMHYGNLNDTDWKHDIYTSLKYNTDVTNIQQRSRKLVYITEDNLKNKRTFCGKAIQLDSIDLKSITNIEYIYICNNCGKCTWDGEYSIHPNILLHINRTRDMGVTCGVHNHNEVI